MIKSFNTHGNHYFGEFHTVGKQKKALAQLRRLHESNIEKIKV